MNRATEQEAYELLRKLGISFQKLIILRLRQSKISLFPTWSASKNLLLKSRKGKNLSCHLA